MSKITEQAELLAKAIQDSPEFAKLKKAEAKLAENTAAQIMYANFQKLTLELEKTRLEGEELPPERLDEMRKKYELLMFNEDIKAVIMAEAEVSQMLMEIQQILAKALGMFASQETGAEKN